jgi:hypothetical protein
VHRYRLRRTVAAGSCATVPVLLFLLCVLRSDLVGSLLLGASIGLVAAAGVFTLNYQRVRRRTLTVTPDGLEVQRDTYRLIVPWSAVTKVQQRRHQMVMAVEELVADGASIVPLDSRGQTTTLPNQLVAGHPASTRVMVSLYDKSWREGPIGGRLRRAGVLPTP